MPSELAPIDSTRESILSALSSEQVSAQGAEGKGCHTREYGRKRGEERRERRGTSCKREGHKERGQGEREGQGNSC